jgi:hypothetical protein
MPLIKLQFKPGVNRDQTNYSGEGGYFACDKIRFRSGYPQKLGGWLRYGTFTLLGVCRSMYNWVTSFSDNLMAYGTNKKVYLEAGANLKDITPIDTTTAAGAITFAAVDGSSVITVSNTAYPSAVGNFVTFSGAVSLGGNITAAVLNQNYEIATEINANSYTIIAKNPTTGLPVVANASDSGDGGAAVVGAYEIPIGFAGGTYGYGWSTGTWGRGAWGSGVTVPTNLNQRDWYFDNFDNDLVFNIRGGAIYIWQRGSLSNPTTALNTRAVLLSSLVGASDVPDEAYQVLVSQNDKHLLAFGCTPFGGGDLDPLLIRWANQDDPTDWTPSATNSAGFIRVSRGSRIIRGLATRQEILVFTESHLFALQFLGTTDVFGLQEYADNISIVSPRAVTSANNITYWMGKDKFYSYSGRVDTLPCTLRNHVFNDLNFNQTNQIFSSTNEGWNEIWWFYPSRNSNVVDKYVIYNHLERIWYYGDLERTAWLDTPLRAYPQAVQSDLTTQTSIVYDHENGVNDGVLPMASFIESNDVDLNDGDKFMLTKRMIPDVSFAGSTATNPTVTYALRPRNFPGAAYQFDANDTQNIIETSVDQYTNQVFIRARARQMAFKIASSDLGVNWQLGAPRLEGREDGKR